MYKISRLMVYLQGNSSDKALIEYVGLVCSKVKVDIVYFLHVARSLDLPDDVLKKYPDLLAPIDENIEKGIETNIKEVLPNAEEIPYRIIVDEGNVLKVMLKRLKQKEIDLLVTSIDGEDKSQAHLAEKLVQFAQCSVAIFPKKIIKKVTDFKKLLVPIDFSSSSKMALETTLYLSNKIDECNILCQYVYNVPAGYHTSGKSYEEFADIMKENAGKYFQEFIKKVDLKGYDIEVFYTLDDDGEPSDKINDFALEQEVDGIVMGSRGRTEAAAMLLGSTTEKLLRYHHNLPMFIVKDKKRTLGFFEALKRL